MKKFFTTVSLFFTPFLFAQEQNQGLDSKINEAFTNELKMFFIDYSNEIKEHISKELKNSNLLED